MTYNINTSSTNYIHKHIHIFVIIIASSEEKNRIVVTSISHNINYVSRKPETQFVIKSYWFVKYNLFQQILFQYEMNKIIQLKTILNSL